MKREIDYFTPSINYEDIDFGNDNYLIARLFSKGVELARSQKIPIRKSPRFNMVPNIVNISCNDNDFILSCKANTDVGSFKYKWKIGKGWKNENGQILSEELETISNTIRLIPINHHSIPSEINVIPIWNNKPQKSMTIKIK